MDHNPFIARNNDLFIMLVAGMLMHLVNSYIFQMSVQTQFVCIVAFSFMAGLFMNLLYQSLEWALFFVIGIQIVALTPYLLGFFHNGHFDLVSMIQHSMATSRYSLFLLSSWVVGLPAGYIVQKLFMSNYYRRRRLF